LGPGAGEDTALDQHRAHDPIVAQHREYDIAAERLLRAGCDLCAALRELPCGLRRTVPDAQGMSGLEQTARDGTAHIAEPEEADVHDALRVASGLRIFAPQQARKRPRAAPWAAGPDTVTNELVQPTLWSYRQD